MTRSKQLLATLLSIVLVTSIGLVATGGFAGAQNQQGAAAVTIEDQPTDGQTVIVDSVTLPDGGFVVIHDSEELDDGDAVGSVLGVSSYLEAGTHEDVPVTVAPEFDTVPDVEVTAMAHQDTNGNEVFDFVMSDGEEDGPYLVGEVAETATPETEEEMTPEETETEEETETVEMTETTEGEETAEGTETTEEGAETTEETAAGTETTEETETTVANGEATETEVGTETTAISAQVGDPVVDEAVIDAATNEVPNTSLEFSDQTSDGTTVTVDRVTLYRGGYVVIHDTEELEDGDATGSVLGHSTYLEPGTYEDVEITLASSLDVENESGASVTAMPHFDTNQNLVFDFVTSFGSADDPYLDENESAVVASATVTAGMTPEETETEEETETVEMTETTEGEETTEAAVTTEEGTETTEETAAGTETTEEETETTEEAAITTETEANGEATETP